MWGFFQLFSRYLLFSEYQVSCWNLGRQRERKPERKIQWEVAYSNHGRSVNGYLILRVRGEAPEEVASELNLERPV
jgi:hypothetical protein